MNTRLSLMGRPGLADALDEMAVRCLPSLGAQGSAVLVEAAGRLLLCQEMRNELARKVAEVERLRREVASLRQRRAA